MTFLLGLALGFAAGLALGVSLTLFTRPKRAPGLTLHRGEPDEAKTDGPPPEQAAPETPEQRIARRRREIEDRARNDPAYRTMLDP